MGRKYRDDVEKAIITLLEESPKTLNELLNRLEIPRRTLLRYIRRLKDRGAVIHLGRGRGYALGDPEILANYLTRLLKGDKFYESMPFYSKIADLIVDAPTKRARRRLADVFTDLLLLASSLTFLYTVTVMMGGGEGEVESRAISSMNESYKTLAKACVKILREVRSPKLRMKLREYEKRVGELALEVLHEMNKTVKRVASHVGGS